jgi:uncharacterized protein (TIGR02996 family)
MSDEVAFIHSIHALPHDRLRWLVYADWLAERNDPREGWCRATAAWMEATEEGSATEIRQRAAAREKAQQKLDPNWLAVLDKADAFTIMLPADLVAHLLQTQTTSAFKQLESWGTVQSDFRMAKVTPGAYVYAIRILRGDVHIVGRLRVNSLTDRTEPFTEDEFLPTTLRRGVGLGLSRPEYNQIVTGTEGVFLRDGIPLPRSVLERLRYINRSGERGLSSLRGGKLTNSTTIQGVFRLTRQSQFDLAWLLFRPGELPPLLPTSSD